MLAANLDHAFLPRRGRIYLKGCQGAIKCLGIRQAGFFAPHLCKGVRESDRDSECRSLDLTDLVVGPWNVHFQQASQVILRQLVCQHHGEKYPTRTFQGVLLGLTDNHSSPMLRIGAGSYV